MAGESSAVTSEKARKIVRAYLDAIEAEARELQEPVVPLTDEKPETVSIPPLEDYCLVILDDATIEDEFGWVFFFQSKKFLETGDLRDSLAGNAPIIISRENGELHVTGTAQSLEYYLDNFIRCGDPHKESC